MRRVCHSLFNVVLLSLGVATGVAVRGQTAQSNPTKIPWCSDFSRFPRLGRPTLQRRGQPAGNTSTVAEEQPEPIKCKGLEDGTVQNLASVRFVGLRSFNELDVIELIEDSGVALRPDRMPDAETADKAAGALKKLLSKKGHIYAVVNAIKDEQFNSVTFQVIEGQRLPLADIRFEGTKVFSPDELKTVTRECLSRAGDSEVAYDEELLEYCLRNTSNFIRSQGYLQAKLGEHKIEVIGSGVVATVRVEEGSLYRLGKIEIEGADHLSAENIRTMLPLSQGDVVDSDSISKWLFEDLKKSYGELGYIEYTAEPVPEFRNVSEAEGIVDFKVIIEEGSRFTLRSLEFEGERLPAHLMKESPLQPGDVYRQSTYAAFVKQLDQSGLFAPIDQDRDSDFRVNEEERVVSIRLKLRRRSNN